MADRNGNGRRGRVGSGPRPLSDREIKERFLEAHTKEGETLTLRWEFGYEGAVPERFVMEIEEAVTSAVEKLWRESTSEYVK